jgi:hypothetical protein
VRLPPRLPRLKSPLRTNHWRQAWLDSKREQRVLPRPRPSVTRRSLWGQGERPVTLLLRLPKLKSPLRTDHRRQAWSDSKRAQEVLPGPRTSMTGRSLRERGERLMTLLSRLPRLKSPLRTNHRKQAWSGCKRARSHPMKPLVRVTREKESGLEGTLPPCPGPRRVPKLPTLPTRARTSSRPRPCLQAVSTRAR